MSNLTIVAELNTENVIISNVMECIYNSVQ